ncbi:WD40 repeat-like protein [Neocallimastix lanati (nom. inval.)]|jgi:ribosome biogenesis protein ENP2|nr:WD40 repeat-like protein [Neocallimastix sp. JGI-2020a]
MALKVSNPNDVKIYSITSAAKLAIPDWLARRNRKSLKHDIEWRNRVELIQDFDFPEASIKIKTSRDGNFIIASGIYKPQFRVYDVNQLAMKFDRHTDCENVQFEILSDDWTKTVHLQADRSVEFHTQFGIHYKTRVPKNGRDMKYHFQSCDLMVVGNSSEVYRLNLEQGRFMKSLFTSLPAINTLDINPAHQLFAFGGEDGNIEFWDPRDKTCITTLNPIINILQNPMITLESTPQVSTVKYKNDGLTFGVGTSTGQVLLYDLRNSKPFLVKDHQYGYPIKNIIYHKSQNVISADTKIVKIWNETTGKVFTNVEPPTDINDCCVVQDTGLMFLANEGSQIQSYYIPQLGIAPKWCTFLDNMTEEMEEKSTQDMYDDYKFVTKKELSSLGLDHLIGTNVLRAYMHGYFVDLRLYQKAKSIANPFEYEEYRRRRVQEKIEKERASRISVSKRLPKVNKAFASQLIKDNASNDKKKIKRDNATVDNPLGDSRFSSIFEDPEFAIDESTDVYRMLHPTESKKAAFTEEDDSEEEEEESEPEGHGSDVSSSEFEEEEEEYIPRKRVKKSEKPKSKEFKEIKSGQMFGSKNSLKISNKSFGDRVSKLTDESFTSRSNTGSMALSFKMNKRKQMKNENNEDVADNRRERRGIKSLNLKKKKY